MLLDIVLALVGFGTLSLITYWFTKYHEYRDKIDLWEYMIEHDYDISKVDWNSLTPKK